ncbi:MAG: hypothetical protein Q9162_002319 [Coniocarpon cinnabarinum]
MESCDASAFQRAFVESADPSITFSEPLPPSIEPRLLEQRHDLLFSGHSGEDQPWGPSPLDARYEELENWTMSKMDESVADSYLATGLSSSPEPINAAANSPPPQDRAPVPPKPRAGLPMLDADGPSRGWKPDVRSATSGNLEEEAGEDDDFYDFVALPPLPQAIDYAIDPTAQSPRGFMQGELHPRPTPQNFPTGDALLARLGLIVGMIPPIGKRAWHTNDIEKYHGMKSRSLDKHKRLALKERYGEAFTNALGEKLFMARSISAVDNHQWPLAVTAEIVGQPFDPVLVEWVCFYNNLPMNDLRIAELLPSSPPIRKKRPRRSAGIGETQDGGKGPQTVGQSNKRSKSTNISNNGLRRLAAACVSADAVHGEDNDEQDVDGLGDSDEGEKEGQGWEDGSRE